MEFRLCLGRGLFAREMSSDWKVRWSLKSSYELVVVLLQNT